MSRLPTPGGDNNDWGDILNDYLSVSLNSDGTLKSSAVSTAGALASGTTAGGDLSGTYPNPTVAQVHGIAISSTAPVAGQALIAGNGTSAAWGAVAPNYTSLLPVSTVNLIQQNQTITPVAGGMLLLMAIGSTWEPNTTYNIATALVSGGNGDVYIPSLIGGDSGSTEPDWPTDGSTINDGNVIEWTDVGPLSTWSADASWNGGENLLEDGYIFQNQFGAFTSGGTEPDWSSAPDASDSLTDGTGQWTDLGVATTWASNTDYALPNGGQRFVVPTSPNGEYYVLSMQGSGTTGVSGSTTPAFQTDSQGGVAAYDGDLLWTIASSLTLHIAAGSDGESMYLALPAVGDFASVQLDLGVYTTGFNAGYFTQVLYSETASQWFISAT